MGGAKINGHRGKVLLQKGEGCRGGDTSLGFEILVALLESLPERKDKSIAMLCRNTAFKLLAEGSALIRRLKRLEEKKVNILAGKLCISQMDLTDKVPIGKSTIMGRFWTSSSTRRLSVCRRKDVVAGRCLP